MTLIDMLRNSTKAFPSKIALISKDGNYTYTQLTEEVYKTANAMLQWGIAEGDVIGLMLPKRPELVITFLAATAIKATVAPINFKLKEPRLRELLENSQIKLLILGEEFIPLVKKLGTNLVPEKNIIVVGESSPSNYLTWDKWRTNSSAEEPKFFIQEKDICYLNYTSGSTGQPKAAIASHANIFFNTIASVESFNLTDQDVHLCMFAVYSHPHEIFARALYLGGTAVLLDTIYPKSIAQSIADYRVTCFMGVAPLYVALQPFAASEKYDLSSLRLLESGGMYTDPQLSEFYEKSIGKPITAVWGSTETTGIALANPLEKPKAGSMGKPCPYYEIKVIGEHDEEVGCGEAGEMLVKGPGVVSNYWNYPGYDLLQQTFKNGYYYTGDIVRKDAEGFYYFMGRKSGMIKVGGEKVHPQEVENTLRNHPSIAEAIILSLPDEQRGEVPRALLVLKSGATLTESAVKDFCKKQLALYMVPRVVEFWPEIPRTPSGKPDRQAILELPSENFPEKAVLEALRQRLLRLDLDLLKLLSEYGDLVLKIKSLNSRIRPSADAAGNQKYPIYTPEEEEEILRTILGHNSGPFHDDLIEEIFRKIIASSEFLAP